MLKTTVTHCMKSSYDVYIGRKNPKIKADSYKWGNPFVVGATYGGRVLQRGDAISQFEDWFYGSSEGVELQKSLYELKGKRLGCWCSPQPCHGDVLAMAADALPDVQPITRFDGDHAYLSNFWRSAIQFNGELYYTVEAAYQASKTENEAEAARIRYAETPWIAKRLGKTVTLRPDWEEIKLELMEILVRLKFESWIILAEKLVDTYPAELIEGNSHGDAYWGVCDGRGENHLGKILMKVREELRNERRTSKTT